ncbi:MT-A70-domain-containing protein [Macrolepiota fuliginosa MF-IS2]|uniref:MT-A70-domain-containing protein n=1 Tax=Macrolepiota fuliginosa MF-IS2 TaxID=1400762 RepID=A0A9P5X6Y1_9AGAR|nr:MT-A70-domain-containing protein [Macrolepiota fuliginosa MF-IS2]
MVATESTTELLSQANELLASHSALLERVRTSQHNFRRQLQSLQSPPEELLKLPTVSSPPPLTPEDDSPPLSPPPNIEEPEHSDLPPAKMARLARYRNYVPEEETIRNDYSQRYVDGGEWPQNWVIGAEPEHRFEEYPKQQRLLTLKKNSVNNHSTPPYYLPYTDLSTIHPNKFDVVLLDPPFSSSFGWDQLQELPIPSLAADPSFVFLWVGSGAGGGLERGREILAKWGYRRCEDVVWVKTNKTSNQGPGTDSPTTSLLTRTKQHCLIGIRGTVRRSTDSWFVHCNVDTDVIIWEGDPADPTRKPPEMYTLIENFCLGIRRLEIFGRPSSLRRGWVTVMTKGLDRQLSPSDDGTVYVEGEEGGQATKWRQETWDEKIKQLLTSSKAVVPMTSEIDALRPKSPVRHGQNMSGGSGSAMSGGVAVGIPSNANTNNNPIARFTPGNRPTAFINHSSVVLPQNPMGQNQMMVQPGLMGMGVGVNQLGMGMGVPVQIDDMINSVSGWNPMMNVNAMGGLNVGGMGPPGALNNVNVGMAPVGPMGGVNVGPAMPMHHHQMMGQMNMGGGGFQGHPAVGFGGGVPAFNPGMNNAGMGWGDQGPMVGGMNMGGINVNMNNMHHNMGMGGQWGGGGF